MGAKILNSIQNNKLYPSKNQYLLILKQLLLILKVETANKRICQKYKKTASLIPKRVGDADEMGKNST